MGGGGQAEVGRGAPPGALAYSGVGCCAPLQASPHVTRQPGRGPSCPRSPGTPPARSAAPWWWLAALIAGEGAPGAPGRENVPINAPLAAAAAHTLSPAQHNQQASALHRRGLVVQERARLLGQRAALQRRDSCRRSAARSQQLARACCNAAASWLPSLHSCISTYSGFSRRMTTPSSVPVAAAGQGGKPGAGGGQGARLQSAAAACAAAAHLLRTSPHPSTQPGAHPLTWQVLLCSQLGALAHRQQHRRGVRLEASDRLGAARLLVEGWWGRIRGRRRVSQRQA